jgi:hypothetical protein
MPRIIFGDQWDELKTDDLEKHKMLVAIPDKSK